MTRIPGALGERAAQPSPADGARARRGAPSPTADAASRPGRASEPGAAVDVFASPTAAASSRPVGTPEGARSAAARLERATRALAAVGRAPERVIDRAASYLSRLGGDARAAAEAPSLRWDPGFLRRTAALEGDGPVEGSPFETLRAALGAVAQLRGAARRDQVFLVTRVDEGFATFRYTDDRLGKVDLKELRPEGLPLGGDAQAPQTWVVDGQGRLGRLRPEGGRYTLERVGHFQVEVGAPLFRVTEPAPLDAVGVAPMVVPERQVNHGKNVAWRPRYAFAPGASIDELSNTLRFIDQKLPKSLSIKAGGSRHSWSPAAATSGVYIHPEGIRFIEPAADASMKASVPSALRDKLVRVGSGTRVRELNAALWDRGLSLPALGGFDGQTLGGVLPTGTHGSVLEHGPLASRVRSIDLVTARGEQVRIEPKDGLTDPVRFAHEHPKMSLVQDDATFQAAQINMGTMGVVHAYVLEAAERFHLTEVRTRTDVADVLRVLEDGNIYHAMDVDQVPPGTPPDRGLRFEGHPERAYHLEVLLNPHSDQVIITSRQPTEVDVEPFDMSRRPGRDLFRSLDLGDRFTRPALSTWLSENLPQAMGWTAEKLTRLLPAATPKVVDQALATLEDPVYVQRSYNVFNIGDGANAIPALSGTLYVPLAGDRYLKALQIFRDTARSFAEEEGRYQTGPLSMRFVRGSEAMLAAGEDVCSFEIIFAGGTPHAEAMMKAYLDALTAELGGEVTFHWGQMLNGLEPSHVAASYPEYPAWKAIRDGLDPDGRFLNSWQRSILPE